MASAKRKPSKKAPEKPAASSAKKPAKEPKKLPPHGTRTRYVNYKCKCPRCKRANADYFAKRTVKANVKAAKVPKGPHLNLAEKAVRDTLIVTRRAQGWGWESIAAEVKLGIDATKKAHKRKVASLTSLMEMDATKILEGLIQGLQYSIGDLEQLAVAAVEERNMSASVSAKRAANEAREKLQELLQTTGLLPHDLGTIKHQIEFRVVVIEVVNLVHTFVGQIEAVAVELPPDKRELVHQHAGELFTGLEHLDGSTPSTNGGSNGTGTSEKRTSGKDATAAAQGGGGDTPE
jgi:hypothetical protein